jgi:hypothetical protein
MTFFDGDAKQKMLFFQPWSPYKARKTTDNILNEDSVTTQDSELKVAKSTRIWDSIALTTLMTDRKQQSTTFAGLTAWL